MPTTHENPSKISTRCMDCPCGDPSSEETLRSITSQIHSTCRDLSGSEEPISEPPPSMPRICPLASPTNIFVLLSTCRLEGTSVLSQALPRSARGRQEQHTSASSPRPRQSCTHTSPPQEVVCILGRMLKNISDPQTFTF